MTMKKSEQEQLRMAKQEVETLRYELSKERSLPNGYLWRSLALAFAAGILAVSISSAVRDCQNAKRLQLVEVWLASMRMGWRDIERLPLVTWTRG